MARILKEQSTSLYRDYSAYGNSSTPFQKISTQVVKALPIQRLDSLYDNFNRITSYEQYAFRRYTLQTLDVANYATVSSLFSLNAWLMQHFYQNLAFWYRKEKEDELLLNGENNIVRLSSPSAPIEFIANEGISLPKHHPNACSTQYTLVSHLNKYSNQIVFAFTFRLILDENESLSSRVPFLSLVSTDTQAIDSLYFHLEQENILVVAFNDTEYKIKIKDIHNSNSIVVAVTNVGSLLPFIHIYINKHRVIHELLLNTQKVQGLSGTLTLTNNSQCSLVLNDIVGFDCDTTESIIDYAIFRALAAAPSLEYFFSTRIQNEYLFNRTMERFIHKNTMYFSCTNNFIYDNLRNKVLLSSGSSWQSSWSTREHDFNLEIVLAYNSAIASNTCATDIIEIGDFKIQLSKPSGSVIWSIYQNNNQLVGSFLDSDELEKKISFRINSNRKARQANVNQTVYGTDTLYVYINNNLACMTTQPIQDNSQAIIKQPSFNFSLIFDKIKTL